MRISFFLSCLPLALAVWGAPRALPAGPVSAPATGSGAGEVLPGGFVESGHAFTAADSTAEDVLRAMHERYHGKWPRNVTFVQTSTFHEPDGTTRQETWYEAIAPGMLRIDIAPVDSGNGILFRNDSIYQFKRDSLVAALAEMHPLMVLSRDVYEIPVARTAEKLRRLGFDLTQLREDTWQGRPAWVIGAEAGDERTPQFWIDRENLYFVRLIEPSKQDSTAVSEVRFNEYRRLGGGWIETEVDFLVDGKRVFFEEYDDVRQDVDFAPELFDPRGWGRPAWVAVADAQEQEGRR